MDIKELWVEYKENPTEELKLELFHYYLKWAEGVGKKFIFSHVCISYEEDIIQFARLGLLNAVERYVITKGATFKTYAGKRVYYHIIDCLRKDGTYKRSSASSDEKYSPIPVSLNSLIITEEDDDSQPIDFPDGRTNEGEYTTRDEEFMEEVALAGLGERELDIVKLYFVHGHTMEEISMILEYGESRISKIMTEIIKPTLKEHYEEMRRQEV